MSKNNLNCLLFHISTNAKLNKQITKPAAITATTISAVLSVFPLAATCSRDRPVPMSFAVVLVVVGAAVVAAALVVVEVVLRCVGVERFRLVVTGCWVTFEEGNDNH